MDISISDELYGVGIFDSAITFPDLGITPERTVTCYEIEIYTENGGTTFVSGEGHQIKSGCVLIARPGDIRHTELPLRAYYAKISADAHTLTALLDGLPRIFSTNEADALADTVRGIMLEGDPLMRHSGLLRLLALLRAEYVKWQRLEQIPHSKSREAVGLAIEYMEKHYTEKCTLAEIAAYAHFSPVYFHGLFKLATGKTPYEYLLALRITQAKQLLITGNLGMSEIAEKSGFTSQAYFNYSFKKATSFTPSEYRRQTLNVYLSENGVFR